MTNDRNYERQRSIAVITIIVIIAALLYLLVVAPAITKIRKQKLAMLQLRAELSRVRADMKAKDRTEQQYEKVKFLFSSAGSAQQDISQFSKQLNSMYADVDIQIRSIKIMPVEEHKYYRKISIKLEFTGPVRDVFMLLFKIETAAAISIDKMAIRAGRSIDKITATVLLSKITAVSR